LRQGTEERRKTEKVKVYKAEEEGSSVRDFGKGRERRGELASINSKK
jgi:hypothetical protein